jgi:hypothetical protein
MKLDALLFDPLLPLWLLVALAACVLAALALAAVRRLAGWPYRGLAVAFVFLALLNPSLKTEERQAEADIVIVVVDRSSSQGLSDRAAQTEAALAHVTAQLAARPATEMRLVEVADANGPGGSEVMTALAQALSETAQDRIAGAIVISDGQIHDTEFAPKVPAPLHLLLTGRPRDWDRRLVVKNAPGFAILGEPITLTLLIEDQGAAPQAASADLILSVDGGPEQLYQLPVNREVEVDVSLGHGGINILQFSTPEYERRIDRSEQWRGCSDQCSARSASGLAGVGGAASGRAHMAQFIKVRQQCRFGAFHNLASTGKTRWRAGDGIVFDCLSNPRIVSRENWRIRSDCL